MYKHVQGGNVPGGHNVIYHDDKPPFIPSMKFCNAITLRNTDIVVDIGAYVGTFAIRCARFPVRRVIAYEPTPYSYSVLNLTKLSNLETHPMAVVGNDEKSTVDFYLSKGIGVANTILPSTRKPHITVPAIRFKDAIAGATVIKIDVEGAEYGYDMTMPNTVRAIIIDFHPSSLYKKDAWMQKSTDMIIRLEDHGFLPIIKTEWSFGYNNTGTRSGAWERVTPALKEVYEPMITGKECCGCGKRINGIGKSLCPNCYKLWSAKHRKGYMFAEYNNEMHT